MLIRDDEGQYSDVVYVQDHLGSARAKVKDRNNIIGEYDYLPYGELTSYSTAEYANDFLYGGKELEAGHDVLWYDSGARYQTTHGIFTSLDPLAEKCYSISPYAYCAGNPIFFVDDSGNDLVIVGKGNSSVTFKTDLVNMSVNISRLGVDWNGNYSFEGNELLEAALDIAGVFDPTGVADAANASLQLSEGKYGDAFVSALGLIPYVGDVAKQEWAKTYGSSTTLSKESHIQRTVERI